MKDFRTLADLRPASYNPRVISTRQREALQKSYIEFGDLSGLVVNRTTGNIVGGHQRTDIFRHRNTRIDKQPHRDNTGTVAIGHAVVPRADGGTMRIPYREVEWSKMKEYGANIAANAGGGEFDDVKLGRLVRELEKGKFAIENIPIDTLDLKRVTRAFDSEQKRNLGMDGDETGEFAIIDSDALKAAAEHQCPSCGYSWSGSTKPAFAELHRLTDDNPAKVQARALSKQIRQVSNKTGKPPLQAAKLVAERRIQKIQSGDIAGHYQPDPPAKAIISKGRR